MTMTAAAAAASPATAAASPPLLKGGWRKRDLSARGDLYAAAATAPQVQNTRKSVEIYTDGACSGNPGPGGWAAILIYGRHKKEIAGFEIETTNNRMEMTAAIQALERLKEPCDVTLYSDSSYLVNAFQKNWVGRWQQNNWLLSDKKHETKNSDLWRILVALNQTHNIHFIKVAGHSDVALNNRCDELAVKQIHDNIQTVVE